MLEKHAERNSGTIPTKVQTKRQLHHDNYTWPISPFHVQKHKHQPTMSTESRKLCMSKGFSQLQLAFLSLTVSYSNMHVPMALSRNSISTGNHNDAAASISCASHKHRLHHPEWTQEDCFAASTGAEGLAGDPLSYILQSQCMSVIMKVLCHCTAEYANGNSRQYYQFCTVNIVFIMLH